MVPLGVKVYLLLSSILVVACGQAVSFNGHWYQVIQTTLNWTDVRDNTVLPSFANQTGYLASITSQGELDFVVNLMNGTDAWLGS